MSLSSRIKSGAAVPRREERFAVKDLACPIGDVADCSASGMRLRRKGKPPVKEGQVERFTLMGATQRVHVEGKIVWIRRTNLVTNTWEIGVQFVGLTAGQSAAVLQLARYGFVGAGKHQHAAPLRTEDEPQAIGGGAGHGAGASDGHGAASNSAAGEAPNWTTGSGAPPGAVRASVEVEDLYAIFDLPRAASQEQIHAQYRRLARTLHPDVTGKPEDTARFVELSKAYKILGDAEVRARYDALLGRARPAA